MTEEQGYRIIRLLSSINLMLGVSAGAIFGMGVSIIYAINNTN